MTLPIEIPRRKGALYAVLLVAVALIAMGGYALSGDVDWGKEAEPILWVGGGLCLFIGVGLVVVFGKKLNDRSPGLIVDEKGITDHSTISSVGFVAWHDIHGLRQHTVGDRPFIMLKVEEPERYLAKASSWLARNTLQSHLRRYQTTVVISLNALKVDPGALWIVLSQEVDQRNRR